MKTHRFNPLPGARKCSVCGQGQTAPIHILRLTKKQARDKAERLWSELNDAMGESGLQFFIELTGGNIIEFSSWSGYIQLAKSPTDYQRQMDEELHG